MNGGAYARENLSAITRYRKIALEAITEQKNGLRAKTLVKSEHLAPRQNCMM
jgi:hypothetical protein